MKVRSISLLHMSHGELFKIEKQMSPSGTYGHQMEYPYSSYLPLLIAFQFLCLSNSSSCCLYFIVMAVFRVVRGCEFRKKGR